MIGVNRRRMMGDSPYDKYGYIEEGKVFHLDGIDKGSDPSAWTDLAMGLVFPFTTHSTVESDGVRFDGGGLLVSSTTIHRTFISRATSTIEIVYEPCTDGTFVWGVGCDVCPQFARNTGADGVIGLNETNGFTDDGFVVMSCNVNAGVGDGVVLERGNTMVRYGLPGPSNPYIWIGGRNYGSPYYYKGKILCIRAYNRLLTIDEMRHNQSVDNKRFNLGLTI